MDESAGQKSREIVKKQGKEGGLPSVKPKAAQALSAAADLTRAVRGHARQMQSTPAAMIYGLASGVMLVLALRFMLFDARPVAGAIMLLPGMVLAGFCWHYMKNN